NHVVVRRTGAAGSGFTRLRLGLLALVHLLGELVAGGGQRIGLGLDGVLVAFAHGVLAFLQRGFDRRLFFGRNLVAVFGERLLHRVDHAVRRVARGRQFDRLVVLGGIGFGVLHHLLDLGFGQAGACLDLDLVFLAGGLVL